MTGNLPHASIPTSSESLVQARAWTRFPSDEMPRVAVRCAGHDVPLAVCDESYGGIGVLAPNWLRLNVNDAIELEYYGAPIHGTVRFVLPHDETQRRVGIEWTRRPSAT